ncbi:Adenosine deaminase like protein [Argiope bruennichi]|uniref:adenosine deaminase n=1 Tax=Argiope bruennichi TaxID=94029 RepID=A0A8T0EW89_ARGBR|nr:Adenosine deaminase like protein [Argiope bruennichi]
MEEWKEHFDSTKIPKYRVELHIHLDGSVRPETIWEISQRKGIHLASSSADYCSSLVTKQPSNLANFLAPIATYLPVIAGDEEAIERIAFEFCEDAAREHILYAETRYSPHLLSAEGFPPEKVVECINRGLKNGCERFGVDIRSILCSIRGKPGWSKEVVELCQKYRDERVIAMDIAGDTNAVTNTSEEDVEAFQSAYRLGIHRTVHAGEDGPADQVRFALEHLFAERIGHGYHVVDDDALYRRCLDMDVHFEACPHSSLLTGSVTDRTAKHPIVRFAEDRANFSINRDDSTLIQKTLDDDYELLRSFGLNDLHFARANFNAARSAFLPDDEKQTLIDKLMNVYGVPTL